MFCTQFVADIGRLLVQPEVPMLTASKINTDSATIKMSSDIERAGCLKRVRIRQIGADEWKEHDCDHEQNSQIILGLKANTKYAMYGMYKVMDIEIWSEQSKPVMFTTYDERGKVAVVFAYWMRTIMSRENMSFRDLVDLVLRFYLFLNFEWDSRRSHDEFALMNDGKSFNKSHVCYRSLCSTKVLSSDIVKARWEMTLRQRGKGIALLMGFIDGRYIGNFDNSKAIGGSQYESALLVMDNCYPTVMTNGKTTAIHKRWKYDIKCGDVVSLVFDFRKKNVSAFYNFRFIGAISKNLPRKVYLAASAYFEGTTFETTLFEAL